MGLKIVENSYELELGEKWASHEDVEENMDYIKDELMNCSYDEWAITAFKLTRSRRFEDRKKGFGKLGGKGYDFDLDVDITLSSAEECALRFVIVRDHDDESSSESSSESESYDGDRNLKIVDNDYELVGGEKWAGVEDIKGEMDWVKRLMHDQWQIVGFKMNTCSRFDSRMEGFGKVGGSGYDWDIDEDMTKDAVCELDSRMVKISGDADSSISERSDSSDSESYNGDGNLKIVDNGYELETGEKWAGVDDVKDNIDSVKDLMDERWQIVGFKMDACKRFDKREKGFAKIGGSGYHYDIDENLSKTATVDLGSRFVKE